MLESWRLVLRCGVRLFLVGGAITYSALAPALGLGDITLHSALNQPLSADIALVDVGGLEEGELSVSLATADEFSRAGVERVFFLNNLKFTPILRGNRSLIRVTSSKAVKEPFLNFVVQLNQPNGRLLREYTVLIDPPGTPGIEPVADEPVAEPQPSAFPTVKPASAPAAPVKKPAAAQPAVAPVSDPVVAEQLAATVLQNQQLQKTIDELNAKLAAQDEQIADQKKQITELQTQLAEVKQPPAEPTAPLAAVPAPAVVEEATNWPLIIGLLALLALVALVLLGLFLRHRRQQVADLPEAAPDLPTRQEPMLDHPAPSLVQKPVFRPASDHREEAPASNVLEGVGIYLTYGRFSEAAAMLRDALIKEPQRTDLAVQLLEVLGKQGDVTAYDTQESSLRDAGFDPQKLQDIRASLPKLSSAAPVEAAPVVAPVDAVPNDEFQLNLDEMSMDSNWDLVSPFDSPPATAKPSDELTFTSNLHVMPDVYELPDELSQQASELEWDPEPDTPTLDDDFLDEFNDAPQSLQLEPLSLAPAVPSNAGKLEQAQTCIDDGDLDRAIKLLNELLKDGDEPLKQTARSLLAGIG
ncbi:FimV/HubP family polar landmark protein [Pseudomonas arsenicoxydans]|uniref:Peptidoglycan-binding protein LysM n=1 Tax=Pseudomonas arsenicoxydans TaxID=702115 RepID=A0A502HY88_9PSED|nr:FimV/HubP family polar landmark protein [Pseudomonas arsenicoxydans]TPG79521.1 peptidoglycan-binding protein LysM [Pseudomonas arsenicoxydans]